MLHGERVVLREVRRAELPQVFAWRYDVDNWALASAEPFVPVPFETFERIWTEDREGSDARHASFGLEVEGRLVGTCLLWGIDSFNRLAHVGITIGSREARGQGIGRDALAVLSDYGFRLHGLHRLQVDTLGTNEAMLRTARSVGYREEGRLRGAAFVGGSFVDEVVLGLLADEWHGR